MKTHPCTIDDLGLNPRAVFGVNNNRVSGTDGSYPYQKHGWRAQRATPLVACEGIRDAVFASVQNEFCNLPIERNMKGGIPSL